MERTTDISLSGHREVPSSNASNLGELGGHKAHQAKQVADGKSRQGHFFFMITIIAVGKIKNGEISALCNDYLSRIRHYCRIEVLEAKDLGPEKEADEILKKIKENSLIIALCLEGKQFSSEKFAELIKTNQINSKPISFVIGSAEGLSEKVKEKAHLKLSLSQMTFPHEMARVLLLEQVYRAFSIINRQGYHK